MLHEGVSPLFCVVISGSGPLTLGIEKEKAKCGKCRLPCRDTRPAILRLLYAALIAGGKRATSSITAPTAHATGRVSCGAAVGAVRGLSERRGTAFFNLK